VTVKVTQTYKCVRCDVIRFERRLIALKYFLRKFRFKTVRNHLLPLLKPVRLCLGPLIVLGQLNNQLLADKVYAYLRTLQIIDSRSLLLSLVVGVHATRKIVSCGSTNNSVHIARCGLAVFFTRAHCVYGRIGTCTSSHL
jgi:hypothetical protein